MLILSFRMVNILHEKNSEKDWKKLWQIVKQIRARYVVDFSASDACSRYESFVFYYDTEHFLKQIESEVHLKVSSSIHENVSESTLQTAVEMFFYLSFCPRNIVPWKLLFTDVFFNSSIKSMILTLNRIIRVNQDNPNSLILMRVLQKLEGKLSLKFKNLEVFIGEKDFQKMDNFDVELFQSVSNHPVHIINKEGTLSPSSFIPFCQFGNSVMGVKIDQFDEPVCNNFVPKLHNDQICYEIDLNKFKKNVDDLKLGLILFLDYNEDRQVKSGHSKETPINVTFLQRIINFGNSDMAKIILNTIGKYHFDTIFTCKY